MKSEYKRIGDFIQLVDLRNNELKELSLVGVSINKNFIPSVANTVGTNMKNYKIIKKNQFACSLMQVRRDKKIPVALFEQEEAIISQAYPVFEIKNTEKLLPKYLMMWMSRSEFDREACFYAVGGVRGSLEWDDFCDMKLPILSPTKQKEIVKEYETITNRIKLNEQLTQKLELTAQTIYKHWFVDFEFPNKEGKPYKSSSGKMVYNDELDMEVPEGWEICRLNELVDFIDGDRGINYPKQEDFHKKEFCLFLNAGNVTKKGFKFDDCSFITKEKDNQLRKGKLIRNDIVITSRGTVGNIAYYNEIVPFENIRINSGMVIVRAKLESISSYLYELLKSAFMKEQITNYISGSAQPQLPIKDLKLFMFIKPNLDIIIKYDFIASLICKLVEIKNQENLKSSKMKDILLSKLLLDTI